MVQTWSPSTKEAKAKRLRVCCHPWLHRKMSAGRGGGKKEGSKEGWFLKDVRVAENIWKCVHGKKALALLMVILGDKSTRVFKAPHRVFHAAPFLRRLVKAAQCHFKACHHVSQLRGQRWPLLQHSQVACSSKLRTVHVHSLSMFLAPWPVTWVVWPRTYHFSALDGALQKLCADVMCYMFVGGGVFGFHLHLYVHFGIQQLYQTSVPLGLEICPPSCTAIVWPFSTG